MTQSFSPSFFDYTASSSPADPSILMEESWSGKEDEGESLKQHLIEHWINFVSSGPPFLFVYNVSLLFLHCVTFSVSILLSVSMERVMVRGAKESTPFANVFLSKPNRIISCSISFRYLQSYTQSLSFHFTNTHTTTATNLYRRVTFTSIPREAIACYWLRRHPDESESPFSGAKGMRKHIPVSGWEKEDGMSIKRIEFPRKTITSCRECGGVRMTRVLSSIASCLFLLSVC